MSATVATGGSQAVESSIPSSVMSKNGQDAEVKELRSDDGQFSFVVSKDGSLFLYTEDAAIWAIYTFSQCSPRPDDDAKLVVKSDGNLVVVHKTRGVVWSTESANGAPGPFRLVLQNDGDCVLFNGNGGVQWATRTSGWGQP